MNTLEELKLAQAKKCRIEYQDINGSWRLVSDHLDKVITFACCRIHPDDEWKARLPRLREGAEWACDGCHFQDARPYVIGERYHGRLVAKKGFAGFTTAPVPPEFLHESELAKQPFNLPKVAAVVQEDADQAAKWYKTRLKSEPEATPQPPCDCIEKCGKFWVQRCSCQNSGDLANAEAWCCEQNAKQPEATPEPDYGEPWSNDYSKGTKDKNGVWTSEAESTVLRNRIIACVNALRGVSDPAAFVAQAKANAEKLAAMEQDRIMQDHLESHQ